MFCDARPRFSAPFSPPRPHSFLSLLQGAIVRKGFALEAFHECLEEYQELGVIAVDAMRTRIEFIG